MKRLTGITLVVLLLSAGLSGADVVTMDDGDAGFSITDASMPRTKGGNYDGDCYLNLAGETATWTPTLSAGVWAVAVWNPTDTTSIVDATTTVNHANGSSAYTFRQTSVGGQWAGLGFYSFDGVGDSVTVTNASNYGYADAVQWISADEQPTLDFQLGQTFAWSDDGNWGTAKSGQDRISDTAGAVATWGVDIQPGTYTIDFEFLKDKYRSPDTIVQVWDSGTQLGGDLIVDQYSDTNPDSTRVIENLGQYTFTGNRMEVKVIASGNQYASSDGLQVTLVPEPATMSLLAIGAFGAVLRRRK
ncbi:MAG: PEP-CTERM sorting domain-containing protein [Phycisphaerae bacterium]